MKLVFYWGSMNLPNKSKRVVNCSFIWEMDILIMSRIKQNPVGRFDAAYGRSYYQEIGSNRIRKPKNYYGDCALQSCECHPL
ncbi:hypothetical protein CEXT_600331 [Caerostris extrusa]|uniref:Uncharacterized protein n=1 Tax=Caerostris extrusa TaxID=172846 RepID=A0AAV4NDW5_CAEEX|nr:hypothetical protein CEXT_600331 [Caerostris extrusa]